MTHPVKHQHLPYEINPEENRLHFFETHWKRVALELILRHVNPAGMSLLDYGCGRGETLEIFGKAGFKTKGADVDPECVRLASKHGPAELLNIEDPVGQFGAKSVDVVTCFHVLEHVDNPKRTLTALREIASKYLLIAVPNLRYLHWIFTKNIDLAMVNEGHLQSWDHWHFRNLAERHCGLELVEWGSDATILPVLSPLAQKILGDRGAIRLETGLFRKIFPFHCVSVLGLWRIKP